MSAAPTVRRDGPFSPETIEVDGKRIRLWETCIEGHEWERIDFDLNRGQDEMPRIERVTRCKNCGAPRCEVYHHPSIGPMAWEGMSDNQQQRYRCTLHRHHHDEKHDFLTGERIPIGGDSE